MERPARGASRLRLAIVLILLVSLGLRLGLVLQGGQNFFGDEDRYDRGVQLYLALLSGDFTKAGLLAVLPEHMLFTWCAALLTAGQHLLAQFTPHGQWLTQPVGVTFTLWIGAVLLSLFSTLNLWLTHRLARVLGAGEEEAAWVLLLMATAHGAFYYARHLLPYECALSAALLALIVGLGGPTPRRAFWSGALAAITYGLYNGFWFLVPVIWLTHAVAQRREVQAWRLRGWCASGAAVGLALPLLVGTLVGGSYFWAVMLDFSGSVKQGVMTEGWSLPWEYFWHAEGAAGAAVATLIAFTLLRARRRNEPLPRRVALALFALGAAYLLLVFCSVGLRAFVVYGRTVKPFVPLVCLLGGWALATGLAGRPRLKPLVALAALAAGGFHFEPHYSRVFPREIEIAVLRHWGNPKHTISVAGSMYVPLALPVTRPDLALVNAQLLYPLHLDIGYPPGRTLLRFEHPLAFRPFHYEGFNPRERAFLRTHDISIRLIALADPAAVPDDLPEHLRARPLRSTDPK